VTADLWTTIIAAVSPQVLLYIVAAPRIAQVVKDHDAAIRDAQVRMRAVEFFMARKLGFDPMGSGEVQEALINLSRKDSTINGKS